MIKPSHCWVWDDNVINEHKKSKITIEVWLAANIFANKRIGLLFETWFLRGNILDPEVNIFDMFIDSMFLLKYVLIYTISCGSIYKYIYISVLIGGGWKFSYAVIFNISKCVVFDTLWFTLSLRKKAITVIFNPYNIICHNMP